MRIFLRGFIFSYIALIFSQQLVKTYIVFDDKSFWLIVLALSLLNIFKRSILSVVYMPSKGIFFQFVSFFLTALLLNILVAIVPNFRFLSTSTPSFIIFGFVIPSIYLTAFSAGIFTSAAISLVSNFFYWLSSKK